MFAVDAHADIFCTQFGGERMNPARQGQGKALVVVEQRISQTEEVGGLTLPEQEVKRAKFGNSANRFIGSGFPTEQHMAQPSEQISRSIFQIIVGARLHQLLLRSEAKQ